MRAGHAPADGPGNRGRKGAEGTVARGPLCLDVMDPDPRSLARVLESSQELRMHPECVNQLVRTRVHPLAVVHVERVHGQIGHTQPVQDANCRARQSTARGAQARLAARVQAPESPGTSLVTTRGRRLQRGDATSPVCIVLPGFAHSEDSCEVIPFHHEGQGAPCPAVDRGPAPRVLRALWVERADVHMEIPPAPDAIVHDLCATLFPGVARRSSVTDDEKDLPWSKITWKRDGHMITRDAIATGAVHRARDWDAPDESVTGAPVLPVARQAGRAGDSTGGVRPYKPEVSGPALTDLLQNFLCNHRRKLAVGWVVEHESAQFRVRWDTTAIEMGLAADVLGAVPELGSPIAEETENPVLLRGGQQTVDVDPAHAGIMLDRVEAYAATRKMRRTPDAKINKAVGR
jgi:hypothetical protein